MGAMDSILSNTHSHVAEADAEALMDTITFDDISNGAKRSPRQSSQGRDGLRYEIIRSIIEHPSCRELTIQIYKEALNGVFLQS